MHCFKCKIATHSERVLLYFAKLGDPSSYFQTTPMHSVIGCEAIRPPLIHSSALSLILFSSSALSPWSGYQTKYLLLSSGDKLCGPLRWNTSKPSKCDVCKEGVSKINIYPRFYFPYIQENVAAPLLIKQQYEQPAIWRSLRMWECPLHLYG